MGAAPPPALRRVPGATTATVALVVVAALALLAWGATHQAGSAALPWTRTPQSQVSADPDVYAARLRAAVDDQRRRAGLTPLADATCATQAAARRVDLQIGQRLEHAAFDPVLAACPQATVGRENLSRAPTPPGAVLAAWMASTQQRAEILDAALTETVVACTHDGDDMLCIQLLLGRGS